MSILKETFSVFVWLFGFLFSVAVIFVMDYFFGKYRKSPKPSCLLGIVGFLLVGAAVFRPAWYKIPGLDEKILAMDNTGKIFSYPQGVLKWQVPFNKIVKIPTKDDLSFFSQQVYLCESPRITLDSVRVCFRVKNLKQYIEKVNSPGPVYLFNDGVGECLQKGIKELSSEYFLLYGLDLAHMKGESRARQHYSLWLKKNLQKRADEQKLGIFITGIPYR